MALVYGDDAAIVVGPALESVELSVRLELSESTIAQRRIVFSDGDELLVERKQFSALAARAVVLLPILGVTSAAIRVLVTISSP